MQIAMKGAMWMVRLTGLTQVVLGVLFWTGRALPLVPVHMAIGLPFVMGLWALAGLAVRCAVKPLLVLLAVAWGGVVIALGITQTGLLVGPLHWIVQVAHLLVGFGGMALANVLASQVNANGRPVSVQSERESEQLRRSA